MWKYAAAKNVSGTPTAYINGVGLDETPGSVYEWIQVLQQVYETQYRPAYLSSLFLQ